MTGSLEAKIVVLGSQGVGKTSLVHRYVKNQFSPASMTSTVGASFLTKRVVDDDSDTTVRLQIWDTAGQERFRSISRLYYRGANACILCYSITELTSFEEMGIWLTELRRNLPPEIILHVVGTKADVVAQTPGLRQVPFERCIAYVADNLAPGQSSTPPPTATPLGFERQTGGYMSAGFDGARSPSSKRSSGFWGQDVGWDCCHEVSAESGEGVEEVFRVITRKLVEQNRKMQEALMSATATPGLTPGLGEPDGYFDGINARGSFRVGRDRRSWLGFPPTAYIDDVVESEAAGHTDGRVARRKCC
ncbi:Ras family protein [Phlyctema vagabunda]|uniref:Ras family protein n=1 Tax=Phlyctema vagabunda TaxID=108571 RepID=A0ABR4PAC9_9HELO